MVNDSEREAVELLQQLGLKEYEAKCFAALTRVSFGTAKEVSDIASIPRTRVYDAVRVLESEGLVEIQHTSPQRYRALSVEEAITILTERYSARIESLEQTLRRIDRQKNESASQHTQEVWSLTGSETIAARTRQAIKEADEEVILVVGSENLLTAKLYGALKRATDRNIEVMLGAIASSTREQIREQVPDVRVFETELDWLEGAGDDPSIGVLLMVDRNVLLVSSQTGHGLGEERTETAVFGSGFTNGLVIIARRLLARGLLSINDPAE